MGTLGNLIHTDSGSSSSHGGRAVFSSPFFSFLLLSFFPFLVFSCFCSPSFFPVLFSVFFVLVLLVVISSILFSLYPFVYSLLFPPPLVFSMSSFYLSFLPSAPRLSSPRHMELSRKVCVAGGMERGMSPFCAAIHDMRGKSVCRGGLSDKMPPSRRAIQGNSCKSVCRAAKCAVSAHVLPATHGIVSKSVCRGGMECGMFPFCAEIHGMRGKSVCRRRRGYARNSWPKKSKGQTVTSVWIHFYSVRGIAKFFLWAESI